MLFADLNLLIPGLLENALFELIPVGNKLLILNRLKLISNPKLPRGPMSNFWIASSMRI